MPFTAAQYVAALVATGQLQRNSAAVELGRLKGLPEQLTADTLAVWANTLGRLAPATRRGYVGAARRYLRWLHVQHGTDTDLSAGLPKIREPRAVPRALPAGDVAAVLAACPEPSARYRRADWLRPAVALMVGCGLRCVEVANLDVADYNRAKSTVFVVGKGGHQRVLPVPPETAEVLGAYLGGRSSGPLLRAVGSKQAHSGRLSARWVSKRTARLMAQAGVHKAGDGRSAHALRHTAASDVLDRCHDLRIVQQMLGHQSLATTERYLRVADLDRMRRAMEGRPYAG